MFLAQGFQQGLWIAKGLDIVPLKKLWSWEVEGLTLHGGNTMSPWCCPLSMGGRKGCQNDRTQAGDVPEGSAMEGMRTRPRVLKWVSPEKPVIRGRCFMSEWE